MGPSLLHVAAGLALLQAPAAPPASIAGTVRDVTTGAPLAGAAVALSDLSRTTTADAKGRYLLGNVPPGPQHIVVRFLGYAPRLLDAMVPNEGRLEIDVALRATPLHLRVIEVRPAVTVRGLEEDDVDYPDRAASIAAVRNDPLLAEPDALGALGGGEVVVPAESPAGMYVRGGAADQTAFVLDGVPVLSPYHSAGLFSAWNPDALARVTLRSSGLPGGGPDALSATVAGETRPPGPQVEVQGALSTAQGRLTVTSPLWRPNVGLLVSVRSGYRSGWPGGIASEPEPPQLRGGTGDRLAALTLGALGGQLRLIAYDNDNELSAAAVAGTERGDTAVPRNRFEWESASLGGEWARELGGVAVRVAAWRATSDAGAMWLTRTGWLTLASERRDVGARAAMEWRSAGASSELGLRVEHRRAGYATVPDSGRAGYGLADATPLATLFGRHGRELGRRLELEMGASLVAGAGAVRLDPGAELRWHVADRLVLSGSFTRRHQLAQSLRNPESIVGNVFPADLPVDGGGGAAGVPVARSDQGVVAAEFRPSAGLRIGAQAYLRGFEGLLLPAPATGEPFAVAGFATGTGSAGGVSLEVSVASARYAARASYAYQRVRFGAGGTTYAPAFASAHLVDAGIVVFPRPTLAIRLAASVAAGRRGTTVPDALEWEACNLRDRDCELAGSPHYDGAVLGGTRLPAYVNLELGVRKHWHVALGGRYVVLGLFGTVTNLLGRANVLTYAGDPSAGPPGAVEMRPRSPLVVGLDWQF